MSIVCKTVYTPTSGACIYNSNFSRRKIDNNIYYFIPELNIYIDEISFNTFKNPDHKVFYAIKNDDSDTYYLKPLTKEQHKNYQKYKDDFEYEGSKLIGSGSYGEVRAYNTQKSVIKTSLSEEDDISQDIVKEIAIYRYLKDLNFLCIPRLQNFKLSPNISLQLSQGMFTLKDFIIEDEIKGKDKIAKQFMFRLAKCLKVISSQGIMNLDLKPQNMIVIKDEKDNYKIQIIDWGLSEIDYSREGKSYKSIEKQTLWWRSPEILAGNHTYNYKVDIYSLGLIFLQLYMNDKYPIVTTDDESDQIDGIFETFLNYKYLNSYNYRIKKLKTFVEGESIYEKIKQNIQTILKMNYSLIKIKELLKIININFEVYIYYYNNIISQFLKLVSTKQKKREISWCLFYFMGSFDEWRQHQDLLNVLIKKIEEFEKERFYVGYLIGIEQKSYTNFEGKEISKEEAEKIVKNMKKVFTHEDMLFIDLVAKMLEFNPENRIDYDEIILDPYFQDIPRESIPFPRGLINKMPNIKILKDNLRLYSLKTVEKLSIDNKSKMYTSCLAIQLFDLYRTKMNIPSQIFINSCMVIASKLFDVIPVNLKNTREYEQDILEILDGNVLIPTLMSYYMYKDEEVKDLNAVLYYYNRSDVYKKDFANVKISELIPLKILQHFGISVYKDEFKLNGNFYESEDILIPKNYFEKISTNSTWYMDMQENKNNKPVILPVDEKSPIWIKFQELRNKYKISEPIDPDPLTLLETIKKATRFEGKAYLELYYTIVKYDVKMAEELNIPEFQESIKSLERQFR